MIEVKEMGRRAAPREASEARLQQTQAAPLPGEQSVQVVQHLSASPSVEQKSQVTSEPKPDQPFESNYRGTLRWMR